MRNKKARKACGELAAEIVRHFQDGEESTDWLRIDPKGQAKEIGKWIYNHLEAHFKKERA